jgi:hypothetical protein
MSSENQSNSDLRWTVAGILIILSLLIGCIFNLVVLALVFYIPAIIILLIDFIYFISNE